LVREILMAKSCKKSKGCGNSCISVPYSCQLEINRGDAEGLDKVADLLMNRDAAIKTPQQAANWLERNKEAIALSGGGNSGGPDSDLMVISLEPAFGKDEYYQGGTATSGQLKPAYRGTVQENNTDLPSVDWVERNPVAVTNLAKNQLELNTLYQGRSVDRLNTQGELAALRLRPELTERLNHDLIEGRQLRQTKGLPYDQNMYKMFSDTGMQRLTNINPSPIALPSERSWPFKNLPLPAGSPFQSREKWLKYIEPKLSRQIKGQLETGSSKGVYVAGNKPIHNRLFKSLSSQPGATRVVEAPIRTTSAAGNAKTTKFKYFLTKEGKIVFQTNHPSTPSWGKAEMAAVNQTMRNYREALRRAKREGREGDAERILETMQQL